MTEITSKGHPKGLYLLFATEMWERFNFYGMRAILSLFLINALAYSDAESSIIYGGFLGLCYLTPMLGGFISDRYLGNRACIQLGGLTMGVGQLLLFISASMYASDYEMARNVMWVALGVIIMGNGFFKPNISSMVGSLYPKGDNRLDSAFTIFYMGINLGALIGNAVCSIVGDVKVGDERNIDAFKWGFLAASLAMFLGVAIFYIWKNKFIRTPEGDSIGTRPDHKNKPAGEQVKFASSSLIIWGIIAVALINIFHFVVGQNWIYAFIYSSGISLAGLIITDKSLTKQERDRITVMYMVGFFVIFFWACFEQAGSSLTFIADKQTDTTLFGWTMPPTLVQNFNAIFVIALAPLFSILWIALNKRKLEPISPMKQAIGLFILALGYVVIAMQVRDLGGTKLGVIWLIIMYLLHTIGELCLSPIGLSLVAKLAPARFSSLLMGVWFLSNASGYALAGTLGALIPPDVKEVVTIKAEEFSYTITPARDTIPAQVVNVKNDSAYIVSNFTEIQDYFAKNFSVTLPAGAKDSVASTASGYAAWKLDTATVKNEKGESEIVLKGITNDFSPAPVQFEIYKIKQITSLFSSKETVESAEDQAKIDKSWKSKEDERKVRFAFTSDGKYIAVWKKGSMSVYDLNPAKPKFAGFEIQNLFQFFMVFVILSGVASILLFMLVPLMKKLMHGVR
ncbi:MAG: peptide MFS transporter [Bacteroidota bacterium]|jgi:POT family proton-dependent oligopeptide transporter